MRMSSIHLTVFIFTLFIVYSCKNKNEVLDETNFQKERLTELIMPLQPGKYITYRVDSTIFTNFGRNTEIHRYQVKHVVDALITDNLGRPSYRVFRYISDSTGTQPWQANGSYYITVLNDAVELIEDNLRVIKLHTPVENGGSWPGNNYLPSDVYGAFYGFSNDDAMASWHFFFDGGITTSETIQGKTYNDVYTVSEADESTNYPNTDPTDYASYSFAVEKYSKNVGLVYRELILWEQQPSTPNPYKVGFGIRMWMIAHN